MTEATYRDATAADLSAVDRTLVANPVGEADD